MHLQNQPLHVSTREAGAPLSPVKILTTAPSSVRPPPRSNRSMSAMTWSGGVLKERTLAGGGLMVSSTSSSARSSRSLQELM